MFIMKQAMNLRWRDVCQSLKRKTFYRVNYKRWEIFSTINAHNVIAASLAT